VFPEPALDSLITTTSRTEIYGSIADEKAGAKRAMYCFGRLPEGIDHMPVHKLNFG